MIPQLSDPAVTVPIQSHNFKLILNEIEPCALIMVKEMQANTRTQLQAQENQEAGFSTLGAAPDFYKVGGGIRIQAKIFWFPSNRKKHPIH
jgi:hypothetical protein